MRRMLTSIHATILSRLPVTLARSLLRRAARAAHQPESQRAERQLLVDVSVIINNDARTGIQRVVRALLLQLLQQPPAGWRVRPVFATRWRGYCYAPETFRAAHDAATSRHAAAAVVAEAGDLFLGLDLAAHLLPRHKAQLLQWKRAGVEMHVIVYDLLPVLNAHWFHARTSRAFRRWLRTIAIFADGVVCISNTVKKELEDWLSQQYRLPQGSIPVCTFPLGADIEASGPSRGLPGDVAGLLSTLADSTTLLMVGTVEPRKGHSNVLAAFEQLWQQGREVKLVLVGRPGWKTDGLQRRLRQHPQRGKHLYWLDDASDELLQLLYERCTGVIVASEAEGFGLPLIEAMYHNKPVLARDIPALREAGGEFASFWSGRCAASLQDEIERWLDEIATCRTPVRAPRRTWRESAGELLSRLGFHPAAPSGSPDTQGSLARIREVMT